MQIKAKKNYSTHLDLAPALAHSTLHGVQKRIFPDGGGWVTELAPPFQGIYIFPFCIHIYNPPFPTYNNQLLIY